MLFQYLNNVTMTLALTLDPDDTTLTVLDSDLPGASKYDPAKQLSLTIVGDEELDQYEIVYVTARTGTTFDVLRGQEDTQAATWPAGARVLAAFSAGMLQGLTETPTSADSIAYGGGAFGEADSVENTLDDMGNAIIRILATTDYFEASSQRVGGGLFSGGVTETTNLRWQGSAKRFTTDGFGADLTTTVTITTPTVPPDVVIAVRSADISNFSALTVELFNNAAPTNKMTWNLGSGGFQANSGWSHLYCGARNAIIAGDPSTNLPDRARLTFKDDGTGPLTVDLNFLDVVEERTSYLGSFVRCRANADFDKVTAIETHGFRVSVVAYVEDLEANVLDTIKLWRLQNDGNRIYLTSTANFKAQTAEQIRVTLLKGINLLSAIDIRPAGFVYPGGYNGPIDLDPPVSVRSLVLSAYPRGVGVGAYRSAVELYRFDDPMHTASNLANAQALLTGSDDRAINIDLSALSVADLHTLFGGIETSGNFYTTTLEWQNADNLKSGTVAAARLPIVPINKGGTNADTAAQARINLGVNDAAGNINPGGWLIGTPTVYARAASGNAHFWFQNSAGASRGVIFTAVAGGHIYLQTYNNQTFTFGTDGKIYLPSELRAGAAVWAGNAYLSTNANIVGPGPGSIWLNYGYGYVDAYNAITQRIEDRAVAWANDRVANLQYRKVSEGQVGSGGVGPFRAPAGAVFTGFYRTGSGNPIHAMYYMYLQVYDQVRGWVGFTG